MKRIYRIYSVFEPGQDLKVAERSACGTEYIPITCVINFIKHNTFSNYDVRRSTNLGYQRTTVSSSHFGMHSYEEIYCNTVEDPQKGANRAGFNQFVSAGADFL